MFDLLKCALTGLTCGRITPLRMDSLHIGGMQ
jgi:hypothetical protein